MSCKAVIVCPGLCAGAPPPAQSGSLDDMFSRLGAPGGGGGGGDLGRIDDDAGAASVFGASSRGPGTKKNGWS